VESHLVEGAIAIGAGLATFLATYLGPIRSLERKVAASRGTDDLKPLWDRIDEHAKSTTSLEERAKHLHEGQERHEQGLNGIQEALRHCVTDEEFGAYTQTTNANVQSIGEKLAHATGAMEAWVRTQERR
jgi:hypothetical protein